MRARRIGGLAALGSLAASFVPMVVSAPPAGAVSQPQVVAEGLDNPYKLSFGPDGALYVAEAGRGGDPSGTCVPVPEEEGGGETCIGATGAVTRIDLAAGTQERVVEGLPSVAISDAGGSGALGPVDVEVDDEGALFVTVGMGGDLDDRAAYGELGAELATVVRVDPAADTRAVFADLLQFEADADPDAGQPESEGIDSNPFDLELGPDGWLAVDAGGNDVVAIAGDGTPSLVTLLPWGQAEAPPFLGAPPGTMLPVQPVPTALSVGERGTLVGQLTGFPFPVGGASVFALADGQLTAVEMGLTSVVDIAQAPDGTLYALEFASNGLLAAESTGEPPVSRLIQIRTDGTRKVLLQDELFVPNGVAVGPDGLVYVSNGSQVAAEGEVIVVDPSAARDPAAAAACDPELVPGAEFPDVGGSVHRESIDCLAWWGLVLGLADGTYGVNNEVIRAQVATILARAIERAGVTLPTDPPDRFPDDEGNVHEASINALAALGVVTGGPDGNVRPNVVLSRAALAAFLYRSYEAITGEPLPPGPNAFADDDGIVQEDEVNAVAAAGWVTGTVDGTFAPASPTRRGQLASMVARMLGTLVEAGIATPPPVAVE